MPGYDRFWLDDGQRRAPIAPEARQTDPQQAVARGQFWALSCRPVEHADLMAQSQVLEPEGSTRPEDRGQRCEECREKNEHRRELCKKTNSHALKHFEIFERHSHLFKCTDFFALRASRGCFHRVDESMLIDFRKEISDVGYPNETVWISGHFLCCRSFEVLERWELA